MPEIHLELDLPENVIKGIEDAAKREHRSRKGQMEYILEDFIQRERVKREKQ